MCQKVGYSILTNILNMLSGEAEFVRIHISQFGFKLIEEINIPY